MKCSPEARAPARRSFDARVEAGQHYYVRLGPNWDCATIPQLAAADLPKLELKHGFATVADVERGHHLGGQPERELWKHKQQDDGAHFGP